MDYKQELLGTSYRKAKSVLEACERHEVVPEMEESMIEALVIKLAQAKVDLNGGKLSDYIKGQEWYVRSLVAKAGLDKKALLKAEYEDLNIENSDFDELAGML